MLDIDFYRGKRVFVTGHTGFKGAWLCFVLKMLGAEVIGYSLPAPTSPSLFEMIDGESGMTSVIGDIRDFDALKHCVEKNAPEIIIHLAAQPIVRDGYKDPRYTYETNVMGTVNLLESVRLFHGVKSVLNVTTDKVYKNNEWEWGYRENEPLCGLDPYSNSKSCSELVTYSYKESFLDKMGIAVSTARTGNVIGGGDFSSDRIIPDCVRAALSGRDIPVRNPHSTRPYQHVLESVIAYLLIAEKQYNNMSLAGYYNVGPDDADCLDTGSLVSLFCDTWGESIKWVEQNDGGPHEAELLKLDSSRIKNQLGWSPVWNTEKAIRYTVEWSKCMWHGEDLLSEMKRQAKNFISDCKWIKG